MTGNLQLDQTLFLITIMILSAFPAGFAAGLFGIGGGLITVPILFYIFTSSGIESSYLMHLAVGTSFAIIIPTSTVSVMTHHQHKAVDFSIVKGYGIFVITGVILGTIFAANLKTKPLILFFSVVVYLLAFYLLFLKEKEKDIKINMGLPSKRRTGTVASGFIFRKLFSATPYLPVSIRSIGSDLYSISYSSKQNLTFLEHKEKGL